MRVLPAPWAWAAALAEERLSVPAVGRGPAGPRAPVVGGERAVRGGGLNKREERLPLILLPGRSSLSAGEQQVYFLPFPVRKGECSAGVAGKGVTWVRRQLPFSCEGTAGVHCVFWRQN